MLKELDLNSTLAIYIVEKYEHLSCTKYLEDVSLSINPLSFWLIHCGLFNCSGTLSYIFNSFEGTRTFSDVVAEAKDAGYTEPDPRDDLSGIDVARKVEHVFCRSYS
jgi:hypothetical protein